MRVRFLNSALAAACIAGLHTHSPEEVEISLDLCLCNLPKRGGIQPTIDFTVDTDDDLISVDFSDDPAEHVVRDIVGLETIVNRILQPFTGGAGIPIQVRGRDAVIRREGITVGCKSLTPNDIERVRMALNRMRRNLTFRAFQTERGHRIRQTNGLIDIDAEGTVPTDQVWAAINAYDQVKDKPAAQATPFRLLA